MSSCHYLAFLSLYYFLAFLLLLLHVLLSRYWLFCHSHLSWHSCSFFFILFSSHNSTFLSLYYFLAFLLLLLHVRNRNSRTFQSLLDTLSFFILSSCHNSTFLSLHYFLTFLLLLLYVLLSLFDLPVTLLFPGIPATSSSYAPVTNWPSCHSSIFWH